MTYKLYNDDCFNILPTLNDGSIDLCLTDLPYGTIQSSEWDKKLDFNQIWANLGRIMKPESVVIFFGSQPFTSEVILSNVQKFQCQWIWNKKLAGNGPFAKYQPLKIHEDVIIFQMGKVRYFPIKTKGKARNKGGGSNSSYQTNGMFKDYNDTYYPKSIIDFSVAASRKTKKLHVAEKPIDLLEYFINTYSIEGENVLDFTMGVGSTGVACVNTSRSFVGIEIDKQFYDIVEGRINNV